MSKILRQLVSWLPVFLPIFLIVPFGFLTSDQVLHASVRLAEGDVDDSEWEFSRLPADLKGRRLDVQAGDLPGSLLIVVPG